MVAELSVDTRVALLVGLEKLVIGAESDSVRGPRELIDVSGVACIERVIVLLLNTVNSIAIAQIQAGGGGRKRRNKLNLN